MMRSTLTPSALASYRAWISSGSTRALHLRIIPAGRPLRAFSRSRRMRAISPSRKCWGAGSSRWYRRGRV